MTEIILAVTNCIMCLGALTLGWRLARRTDWSRAVRMAGDLIDTRNQAYSAGISSVNIDRPAPDIDRPILEIVTEDDEQESSDFAERDIDGN